MHSRFPPAPSRSTPPPPPPRGRLARLFLERVGNPMGWSTIDKCIVLLCAVLPFRLSNVAAGVRIVLAPSQYPYADPHATRVFLAVLATIVAMITLVVVVGFVLRRNRRDAPWFVHTGLMLFWLTNGVMSFGIGLANGPFWVSSLGVGILSLLLFGPRYTYPGICVALLMMFTTITLERLSIVPYAPLLRTPPLRADGHPASMWLLYMTGSSMAISALSMFIAHYVIQSWREQEYRLQELSRTDPLTGLTNRRRFREICERELGRAERYEFPIALLMMDLDHFKLINDTHGHEAGDVALVAAAQALRRALREQDVVARYGGEEFACLLPHTTRDEAAVVAERCRRDIASLQLLHDGRPLRLTITVGVATLGPNVRTLDQLVRAADEALYEGKAQGRDRVSLSG